MKKILITAALLFVAATASAQSKSNSSNVYGELGFHNTKIDVDGVSDSPSLNVGSAILGYQFHPNFSAEVFLAGGLSKADLGGGFEGKLDYGLGVTLRPSYKFNDQFEAFVRLGYGSYKTSSSGPGFSASSTDSSLLYGVGANYYFTDKVYGQLSYTSFFDKDGVKIGGFGASVGYKF